MINWWTFVCCMFGVKRSMFVVAGVYLRHGGVC